MLTVINIGSANQTPPSDHQQVKYLLHTSLLLLARILATAKSSSCVRPSPNFYHCFTIKGSMIRCLRFHHFLHCQLDSYWLKYKWNVEYSQLSTHLPLWAAKIYSTCVIHLFMLIICSTQTRYTINPLLINWTLKIINSSSICRQSIVNNQVITLQLLQHLFHFIHSSFLNYGRVYDTPLKEVYSNCQIHLENIQNR